MKMSRIELTILKNLLQDEQYTRQVIPFLKSDYFSERSERVLFEHIFDFFQTYDSLPTIETLSIDINKDNQLSDPDINSILEILNNAETEVNSKWLNDETENSLVGRI